MRVETFAEIFTPAHPIARAHVADPGRYHAVTELPDNVCDTVARVARRTGDDDLAALAATNSFVVSLEHLRDCDPETIRIVYGVRVDREPGDGETPGIGP
jgi:hypothetical protein